MTRRVAHPDSWELQHERVLLSNKELEVIRRTRNNRYATVADNLGIEETTVGTYRYRANQKLDQQVKIARQLLREQEADQREEGLIEIAREAVECLRNRGVEVDFEVQR